MVTPSVIKWKVPVLGGDEIFPLSSFFVYPTVSHPESTVVFQRVQI